jgi:hypothetical protein
MLEDMLITSSHFRVGFSKVKFLAFIADLAREKGVKPHESRDSDIRDLLPYTFVLVGINDGCFRRGRFRRFMKRHPQVSERITQAQSIRKLKECNPSNAELYITLCSL